MRNLFCWLLLALPFTGRGQVANTVSQPNGANGAGPSTIPAVLDYAEEMPVFAGGVPALRQYFATHLTYPPEAVKRTLSGTVVVQFVVDEQGRAVDVAVVRASDPVFDAEAKRVVYLMPWWTPGREHGRPVRVRCTLPLVFTYKRGG